LVVGGLGVSGVDVLASLREYVEGGNRVNSRLVADVLAKYVAATKRVKTLLDHMGNEVGVFCYRPEGYYGSCLHDLPAEVYGLCRELGLLGKVGNYLAFERVFVRALKSYTRFEGDFDRHLVLFRNGVLDWRCLEGGGGSRCLVKPDPGLLVVHRVPWEVDAGVLSRSFSGREELAREVETELWEVVEVFREWAGDGWFALLEVLGYVFLAGDYPLGRVVLLYGRGSGGKSTFLGLVSALLGEDNVSAVCLEDLAGGRGDFAVSRLYGRLANVCASLPGKVSSGEVEVLERLAGGGLVEARRKSRGSFAFKNYAKLLFATNVPPKVVGAGSAPWGRWYLIEFPGRFPRNPRFRRWLFGELLPRVAPRLIAYSILAALLAVREGRFAFEGGVDLREARLRASNSAYAFIKRALELGCWWRIVRATWTRSGFTTRM